MPSRHDDRLPADGPPADFSPEECFRAFERLRGRRPLVQNITNFVAMSVSANVLLGLGASPAMVHSAEEVEDFALLADALVVNIGTLSPDWVASMRKAAAAFGAAGKPWVLDPVGCGATPYRTRAAAELARLEPTVIRGNASEILSLSGAAGAGPRGVDATIASGSAVEAARALSRATGSVIALTGSTDYVTDGERVVAVEGGDPLMALSTALGCALSAVTAAFAAVEADPVKAAVAALAVFGAAGAEAAAPLKGPGHLPAELCDALHGMTLGTLSRRAHVLVETV